MAFVPIFPERRLELQEPEPKGVGRVLAHAAFMAFCLVGIHLIAAAVLGGYLLTLPPWMEHLEASYLRTQSACSYGPASSPERVLRGVVTADAHRDPKYQDWTSHPKGVGEDWKSDPKYEDWKSAGDFTANGSACAFSLPLTVGDAVRTPNGDYIVVERSVAAGAAIGPADTEPRLQWTAAESEGGGQRAMALLLSLAYPLGLLTGLLGLAVLLVGRRRHKYTRLLQVAVAVYLVALGLTLQQLGSYDLGALTVNPDRFAVLDSGLGSWVAAFVRWCLILSGLTVVRFIFLLDVSAVDEPMERELAADKLLAAQDQPAPESGKPAVAAPLRAPKPAGASMLEQSHIDAAAKQGWTVRDRGRGRFELRHQSRPALGRIAYYGDVLEDAIRAAESDAGIPNERLTYIGWNWQLQSGRRVAASGRTAGFLEAVSACSKALLEHDRPPWESGRPPFA